MKLAYSKLYCESGKLKSGEAFFLRGIVKKKLKEMLSQGKEELYIAQFLGTGGERLVHVSALLNHDIYETNQVCSQFL